MPKETNLGSAFRVAASFDNANLNGSSLAQLEVSMRLQNQRVEEILARRDLQNGTSFTEVERSGDG
jgi:hypothetical protein